VCTFPLFLGIFAGSCNQICVGLSSNRLIICLRFVVLVIDSVSDVVNM
jgi:hypothetical protein